ncbi:hypothetical protein, no similarity [Maudiozyma saulgeensis]|uniref:Uncharacterized protein n=1 Tax=Maudiozyma saulgeensis TaxID=1789683 RepID=A0A1X7R1J6_9SACH|nr:hypothetical protein, no similarity [Kazachstania saulgeensis]
MRELFLIGHAYFISHCTRDILTKTGVWCLVITKVYIYFSLGGTRPNNNPVCRVSVLVITKKMLHLKMFCSVLRLLLYEPPTTKNNKTSTREKEKSAERTLLDSYFHYYGHHCKRPNFFSFSVHHRKISEIPAGFLSRATILFFWFLPPHVLP